MDIDVFLSNPFGIDGIAFHKTKKFIVFRKNAAHHNPRHFQKIFFIHSLLQNTIELLLILIKKKSFLDWTFLSEQVERLEKEKNNQSISILNFDVLSVHPLMFWASFGVCICTVTNCQNCKSGAQNHVQEYKKKHRNNYFFINRIVSFHVRK